MNPHYHPYTELASPHSPAPDGGPGGPGGPYSNGHHHQHHPHPPHPHPQMQPQQHHHLNNTNLNNNNNNNNRGGMGALGGSVKVCAGCGGKILERYLLHALDRYWHNSCLKCSCCGAMLGEIGSSCFTKSNMILCKTDYIR
ncbi:hypothetical protein AAG570_001964 [Ranatra chinensis]|uniref:LIM zinc-binding domain-containing protein n=1 Tax=Ranatra chinensis TaxID=642074 RepID=A0ABD0YAV8_9HEMI